MKEMPHRRSRLYSTGAISVVVGIILFLLVTPAAEREANLASLRSDDPDAWPVAVKQLCWIESGREGMNRLLPELDRDRRVAILKVVQSEGCLDLLDDRLRATYYIFAPAGHVSKEAAIASGDAAVGPATAALATEDALLREHAMFVLGGVAPRLEPGERERVVAMLQTMEPGRLRNELLSRLDAEIPEEEEVVPEPIADESPETPEAEPDEIDQFDDSVGAGGEERTGPEEDEVDLEAQGEFDGALRLREPSLGRPFRESVEPADDDDSVLYRREEGEPAGADPGAAPDAETEDAPGEAGAAPTDATEPTAPSDDHEQAEDDGEAGEESVDE